MLKRPNRYMSNGRATLAFAMLGWLTTYGCSASACTAVASTGSSLAVTVIDGDGTTSEIQDVVLDTTMQQFSLAFSAAGATALLAHGVTAAQVQSALDSLPDALSVQVTDDGSGGYTVTFADTDDHAPIQISELFGACQIITFAAPPTIMQSGTGMVTATTTATPSASYPITFSTASTDCSVTPTGTVTGINAGSNNCLITASQVGGPSWEAATATQTLSIQATTPVRLQSFQVD